MNPRFSFGIYISFLFYDVKHSFFSLFEFRILKLAHPARVVGCAREYLLAADSGLGSRRACECCNLQSHSIASSIPSAKMHLQPPFRKKGFAGPALMCSARIHARSGHDELRWSRLAPSEAKHHWGSNRYLRAALRRQIHAQHDDHKRALFGCLDRPSRAHF